MSSALLALAWTPPVPPARFGTYPLQGTQFVLNLAIFTRRYLHPSLSSPIATSPIDSLLCKRRTPSRHNDTVQYSTSPPLVWLRVVAYKIFFRTNDIEMLTSRYRG
eukprot:69946-Pyramimonas_sp.AAC.1